MVDRKKYDDILDSLQNLNGHYENSGIDSAVRQLEDIRDNFDIKLLVVGHFSAGKSALLNALLQRPSFLKEAQQPQTAMATELVYDEQEQAFAYRKDGTKEQFVPDKLYGPDEYSHLEYRLNAPALKRTEDYTIVDTPGFDSGLDVHTQALANYIGVGSAYLVVVDQEKGGLDNTSLRFIQEISHYSNQIAVLINKCDKITPAAAEEIAAAAQDTLEGNGLPYKVYSISARDDNCSERLISIISQFQAQKAFDHLMTEHLKTELCNTEKMLQIEQRKLFLNTYDLDESIRHYERTKEEILAAFERHTKRSKQNLDTQTEAVLAEVRKALTAHADTIAAALLNGNQTAVESIIVETVRPILLMSMKDITSDQIDSIAGELQFDELPSGEDAQDLTEVARNLATGLKRLLDEGSFSTSSAPNKRHHKEKNTDIYHALTGILAAATNVISPWLEVIIILLPDIISLVQGLFVENEESVVKRNFVNNVIPQICRKLYPQIRQSIEESSAQVLDAYKKLLNEKIEQLKGRIESLKEKKVHQTKDFELHKNYIAEDIASVQTLLNQLR